MSFFINSLHFSQMAKKFIEDSFAEHIRSLISSDRTHDPQYYNITPYLDTMGTSHVSVLAEDGSAVSVTSTINHMSVSEECCLTVRNHQPNITVGFKVEDTEDLTDCQNVTQSNTDLTHCFFFTDLAPSCCLRAPESSSMTSCMTSAVESKTYFLVTELQDFLLSFNTWQKQVMQVLVFIFLEKILFLV